MAETYIIAVDFGTTFSGYAFSLSPSHKDPEPQVRRWGHEQGQDTPKTPTCILFDHHGHFLHFGNEAKSTYLETDKDEATKFYYFENFKMELYNKTITNDLQIRDVKRRPMSAMKVFSAALRFLKEEALKTIFINTCGMRFTASDFTWVLTVPAIWDFSARQFMREAAVQAGIVTPSTENNLVMILESEAAVFRCKTLPLDNFIGEHHHREALQQSPGTAYVVVDCGERTIDITVHEVLDGGALKELHKASGNDKGGQKVNKKFRQSLRELFCDGLWEEYERDHPSEAQRFMYDFETVKLTQADAKLNCYWNLGSLVQQRQSEGRQVCDAVEGLSWDNGKILISRQKMESFFHESLVHITDSLCESLRRCPDVQYVLLVGGFAQSSILREHVRTHFSDRATVLCPRNPQEAILRGALMFGREPPAPRRTLLRDTNSRDVDEAEEQLRSAVGQMQKDLQTCLTLMKQLIDENQRLRSGLEQMLQRSAQSHKERNRFKLKTPKILKNRRFSTSSAESAESEAQSCGSCEQLALEHRHSMWEMEAFYKDKLTEARSALKEKEEQLRSFKDRVAENMFLPSGLNQRPPRPTPPPED